MYIKGFVIYSQHSRHWNRLVKKFVWKSKAGTTSSVSKIHNSAFHPLHPHISSAKIIHILPVATSARPHFTFYRWPLED